MFFVELFFRNRGAYRADTGRANMDGAGADGTGTNQAATDGGSGIREKNDHRCFGHCRGGWAAGFLSGCRWNKKAVSL